MNLENIFKLFNDDYQKDNNDENSLLVDFSEHPLFWLSGFNKIIDNHLFFKKYTVKTFSQISLDMNIEELEKAGEELMFRKAWDYIKPINLENPFHVDCIKNKSSKSFINNLNEAIFFFQELEEYEKCALLKKIQDKAKEFLN